MKKRLQGSLTVEAAVVLPIFMMAILSIIYIIKIIFIHESIQYGLNETANEMATYAYVLEKSELLNAQQNVYNTAKSKVSETNHHLGNILLEATNLYATIESAGTYEMAKKIDTPSTFEDMPEKASLGEYIKAYTRHVKEIKSHISQEGESTFNRVNNMMTSIEVILTSMESTMLNAFLAEGLELTNNYIGTKIAEQFMKQYITNNQIKKWHIVGGRKGLDFTRSRYMLENEDIDLVVRYDLTIPIPFPGIKQITMLQRVKVRAYTGDGSYEDGYIKEDARGRSTHDNNEDNTNDNHDERIVYYLKGKTVYHTYLRCIRKISYPVVYDSKYKSRMCKVCTKGINIDELQTIYQVPSEKGTNRYHVTSPCSTHYSKNVYNMSLSEVGTRTECGKCINIGKGLNGKWYTQ